VVSVGAAVVSVGAAVVSVGAAVVAGAAVVVVVSSSEQAVATMPITRRPAISVVALLVTSPPCVDVGRMAVDAGVTSGTY
jgi:hypothetical protein